MTKTERFLLYSLPLISITVEIARSFIDTETKIMAARNYFIFLVILALNIKYFMTSIRFNVYLVLLMTYFAVLLIVGDADLDAWNYFIVAFSAKMILPLGYTLTSTYGHIESMNRKLLITNIFFAVSIILFTIFNIGTNPYGGTTGLKVGQFTFANLYIGPFLLIILPIVYSDQKQKYARYATFIVGITTLLILILALRRTALVIAMFGVVSYAFFHRNQISKIFIRAVAVVFVLLAAFPLYQETLMKQIAVRSDIFNDRSVTENLQKESRLAEAIAVVDERIKSPDLNLLFFGRHLFHSAGNYADGRFGGRPLHLDSSLVLHGAGIIGLGLLIPFYWRLMQQYFRLHVTLPHNSKFFHSTLVAMLMAHIFLLITGGMTIMTFNLISFLYIGAILGLFRAQRETNFKSRRANGLEIK